MEFIHEGVLSKRNINSDGQRFFIWLWKEQLHPLTIDTYRVRAMNSKSILKELYEVIEQVANGVWNSNNIKLVASEARELILCDKILKNKNYFGGLLNLISELVTSDKDFIKAKPILKGIIFDLENNYLNNCLDSLDKAIKSDSIECIEFFTKSIATELINQGYSKNYLLELCNEVFLNSDVRTFNCYFKEFVQNISLTKNNFTVTLKLNLGKENIPAKILDFSFYSEKDLKKDDVADIVKFFTGPEPKLFAQTTLEALDANSAALITKARFGYVLDLLYYGYQYKSRFNLYEKCLVQKDKEYCFCNSTTSLEGFHIDSLKWLQIVEKQLKIILESEKISISTKEKVKGALRYFRLCKESINIEHQFLNLWIAIEQLVRTGEKHKSIIEPIITFVPKIISLQHISRLIKNVQEDFKRCRVSIPGEYRISFNNKNKEKFIALIRDEKQFAEILKIKDINPLLRNRLQKLQIILSTSEEIRKVVNKNHNDIDLHLARMYRIRNKIVHNAAHDLSVSGITTNLVFYVTQVINTILYELTSCEFHSDIWDIFIKNKFTFEQLDILLKKDRDNQIPLEFIIAPLKYLNPMQ